MSKLCESLATLKDYIDYDLKCCDAVIERLKKGDFFFSEDIADKEWNGTIARKNCLWDIKVQVDCLLERGTENE